MTTPTPPEPDPVGGIVVGGGVAVPFSSAPATFPFTGTLTTTVIANDPSNPYGGLTFTYAITNDASSLSAIARMTTLDFTGYQTDVSYQSPPSGLAPTTTDRSASGAVVGWGFDSVGLGTLPPGSASALLVVQTDATSFVPDQANLIDGSTATVASYGPALVPEPTSLAAIGLGVLAGYRRRSRSR